MIKDICILQKYVTTLHEGSIEQAEEKTPPLNVSQLLNEGSELDHGACARTSVYERVERYLDLILLCSARRKY